MSGTHAESDSICIKGGQGSHSKTWNGLLILWSVWLCAFFNYLVDIVVLLSTRHSCLGIPYPSKRGLLEEFSLHFSKFKLQPKHPPLATMQFLFRVGLRCRVLQWRLLKTTSRAYFSEEEALFPLDDQWGRIMGWFHHLWHQANHFPSSRV